MSTPSTPTVQALNRQWERLVDSSELRRRIRSWHSKIPAIPDLTPDDLVATAATRPRGTDCPALDALVALAQSDQLALQVVIRAMLPRWIAIMSAAPNRGRLTLDEIASIVVSIGTETILECDVEAATTPTDYRLWSDTRHGVHRHLNRHYPTAEEVTDPDALTRLAPPTWDSDHVPVRDLIAWIAARADVPVETAHLIAATRTGQVSMDDVAAATGVNYATLAKRRARAEHRLRLATSS